MLSSCNRASPALIRPVLGADHRAPWTGAGSALATWAGGGHPLPNSFPHPCPFRMWWEELPLCALLGRRGQRGEWNPALSLRVRWPEVLSLFPPLCASFAVAADQRAAAGGAQQDQSGRCEWCLHPCQGPSGWLMGLEAPVLVGLGWVGRGFLLEPVATLSLLASSLPPACRGFWDLLLCSD